jgi:glycosyltransferase involved in cell wall biosynthesis
VSAAPLRALVLLYYFPPSGGPGVQRGLKMCRLLPEHGVEPTVVTVEPQTYEGPGEYAPDPSLVAEVPRDLRVVRTKSGERLRLKAALQATRLYRAAWTAAPRQLFERQAAWFAPALAACLAEVERARPDVLLTSSQPYVAHLVGREVRRLTGVPWVADFRDPWTTSWGRSWPSERALAWETEREDEVLRDADRVVANTPGSREELLARRPWIRPAKVDVVPNGYDPEDFAVAAAPRDPAEFVVVHSGAFRATPPGPPRRGLRAWIDRRAVTPLPYDLSTHSPEPLLRAMADASVKGAARTVRARLVGPLAAGWTALARSLGVADRVHATGYLPHREATSHLLAADLLYLPTVTRTDGAPVSNVPAKTYEYLGSGRPVAALAGPGDVRDLVGGRERVTLLAPRDADGLAALIAASAAGQGPAACDPDSPDVRPWRRGELAARMAGVLRDAAGAAAPAEVSVIR